MIRQITAIGTAAVLMQITSAFAGTVINLSTSHAEGRTGAIPSLTVWSGTGLSLNFAATGERIVKAWLDDPSRLTLDFDACSSASRQDGQCGEGATVIHLRRIGQIKFANLPPTPTTLLTVVTEGQGTRKVYYFSLNYGSGRAKYIAVNVNADPRPQLQERQRQEEAVRVRTERIAQGLQIARQRHNSQQNQRVFAQVETLLAQVRGGMSFPEAIRRTNLAPSVLEQLEALASQTRD